ncbi:WhiB family transcriptional regulator [Streptomyces sp. NPDC101150]|uniref:WhiB family transcriptional regulator n=1 Tax=Streptomyces sp. NPDC101150 TaxID=3366114 RepID=UPI003800533F
MAEDNTIHRADGSKSCRECRRARDNYRRKSPYDTRISKVETAEFEAGRWVAEAACRDEKDKNLFFDAAQWHKAARICGACPVKQLCLDTYIDEPYGYFGGATPDQRKRIGRARKHGNPEPNIQPPRTPRPAVADKKKVDRVSPETRQEVVDMYSAGMSLRTIERDLGVPRTTVRRIAKDAGIERTPEERRAMQLANPRGRSHMTRIILKLLDEGYTSQEIAHDAGCHINSVYRVKREIWGKE